MNYALHDGNEIIIVDERFECPELLFKPSFNNCEFDGFERILSDSIMKYDINIWRDPCASIALSVGTIMLDGLPELIEEGIILFAPVTMKAKVFASSERKYAIWMSGSILASLLIFPQIAMVHEEHNYATMFKASFARS